MTHCWGDNEFRQAGGTALEEYTTFGFDLVTVQQQTSERIKKLGQSTGSTQCWITDADDLECWGYNGAKQIRDPAEVVVFPPASVGMKADDAGSGFNHSCGLRGGVVTCWGAAVYGQPGIEPITGAVGPVVVAGLPSVDTIALGGDHTCAISNDETRGLYCWGRNDECQLGRGIPSDSGRAGMVLDSARTFLVSGNGSTTCAVIDGTAKCFGQAQYGAVGNGRVAYERICRPEPVLGLCNPIAIAVGYQHACAIEARGIVKCWGRNEYGQLGDGTTDDRPTAVPVIWQ
jgi:alpha-tubulin suppressor-like RCC1 family protein